MAVSVAQALCRQTDKGNQTNAEDIKAMNESIREIEKQAGYFEEIVKWTETIRTNGGKILERARKMKEKIMREVETLDQVRDGIDK